MVDDEEGMDFQAQFIKAGFGKNTAATEARLEAERIAGLTTKQRGNRRKQPPKKQLNIRASAEARATLAALIKHLGLTQTGVFEVAIAELGKAKLGVKK